MRKNLTAAVLLAAMGVLASCSKNVEKDAQAFVDTYTQEYVKLALAVNEAEWASNTHIVEGDTIHFTFVNAEDDAHSFVLPDLAVSLPPQRVTHVTYVARRSGIFPFVCSVPAHLPMMSGQLIVLAPGAVAETGR
jgi:Heme/copper-type cytochrome/quinol oxidases, subunit 2